MKKTMRLMKEISDDTNRWRDMPYSWIGRVNIVKMSIQSNLHIQCNPYQITNSIFHRTRTKHFTICMEAQKTLINKSNLKKKKNQNRAGESRLPDLRLFYRRQSSRQYGTGIETEV